MRLNGSSLALALAAFMLVGCHGAPKWTTKDVQSLYDEAGYARSLALSTPPIRELAMSEPGYEPWYAGRRDIGPSVIVGYESSRREQVFTYTRDRQYHSHGRVYDRFDETTYRRSYSESSR